MKNNAIKQRIIPNDFNWIKYLELNKDINIIHNKENAINHYLTYGINEKRIYKLDKYKIPDNFGWRDYLELNTDLNPNSSKKEVLVHYIKHGIKEGRQYKKLEVNLNDDDVYDSINDEDILYTDDKIKNSDFLKYSSDIHILKSFVSFILVIDFNNLGGGTTVFLNRIISKYKKYNTFLVLRTDGEKYYLNINEEYSINIELNNISELINVIDEYKIKCKKIFVNHLLGFNDEFIKYIFDLDIKKIGITHDYYNIFDNPQPLFRNFKDNKKNSLVDINKYDILITQNTENIKLFSKIFKNKIDVVPLPDYKYSKKKIMTQNKKINCCIIGELSDIKGKKKLIKIIEYFGSKHKDINFYIIGYADGILSNNQKKYNNIGEFNNLLIKFKPNLIIELSIWPETYSFTLSLSMVTKLPILYFKKPNNSVIKNRLLDHDNSYEFTNFSELYTLIKQYSQNWFYTIKPIIVYNKYWNDLFIDKKEKLITNIKDKFIHDVRPYFIYFPQFHKIYENNINFYDGFDDMKNLKYFNEKTLNKKEVCLQEYSDIDRYDYLLNSNLMQKQIDLIDHYGFSGLAVYYYWFTVNSYTNKNTIMNNVIDKFFDSSLNIHNKKIFFIWANEDWTKNISLIPLDNENIIRNIYNEVSFQKNSEYLMNYFKHKNYLKIDNKPVFYIYHTYLIDNIHEFYRVINAKCIENGFYGVHLVLNSFDKIYENFKNFYINFNYKIFDARFTNKKNQINLDYVTYMNNPYHLNENSNQTIIFDFDNRARLCKPNNIKKSTVCINNTECNKTLFVKKLLNTYDNKNYGELDKILLVNALNEWGESMTFEPSDKYEYYNINLLHELL